MLQSMVWVMEETVLAHYKNYQGIQILRLTRGLNRPFIFSTMTNYTKADGFDFAIIGVDTYQERIIYCKQKMIEVLILDGLSFDEAIEYLEANTWSSSSGEHGPIYLHPITSDNLSELI